MSDAEKLTALADDIAAGFEREPWRDQPGMGYVEIQMDKADEEEYRAMAARVASLRKALREVIVAAGGVAEEGVSDEFLALAPGEVREKVAALEAGLAASRVREAALAATVQQFVWHYPSGINPDLDQAYRMGHALKHDASIVVDGIKREAKLEALRGLPGTTNSDYETDWDAGWDAYCAKVLAAIAALEGKGEQG